jgi:hypothetical protein
MPPAAAGQIPVPFRLGYLPEGERGVVATLKIMVGVVLQYRCDPNVRYTAQTLVRNCVSRDAVCQITCCHAYVRDKVAYLPDVRDVETIQTPDYTLEMMSGDCDDQSVLLACLLESIGFQTRFCAIGVRDQFYSHVSSQVKLGKGWCNLETIVPVLKDAWCGYSPGTPTPVGWFPPDCTCAKVVRVP